MNAMFILAAVLAVDFGNETGRVRPELHSSGFGPTICSQTEQDLDDVRSMGFAYARTHDWGLVNANERVCDYFHIFPLMHLDAKDPKNYVFGPTDYLLKRTREDAGLKVFYRLGTSIEHSGSKVHFNAIMPEDFDKVAEIFAGTVRHYNRGWANGFKWGIRYWEIWNEPEGWMNMWCPPEGAEGLKDEELESVQKELRTRFTKFFVTVLKRLKTEFGDEIKVGGPALQCYREEWLKDILADCKEAGVAPDFISWHGYKNKPHEFAAEAEQARKLCDGYGFTKCELIVNEWHYFGYDDYSWADMQHCSDPKVKSRIWMGPRSHNGIHSACFTLAALADMQRSKLSQAYYYGCAHTGDWGFKDEGQSPYKVFYALKLFGEFMKGSDICESVSDGPYTIFAVKSAGRRELLVVDYGGTAPEIEISVKGVPADAKAECRVLDYGHDLEPHAVVFENGVLRIRKNDANSAAFAVRFRSATGPAADFSVEQGLLERYADRTPEGRQVVFREDGKADCPDGYRIEEEKGRIVISSPTRRGRIYGLGRLLRKNGFRGESAPAMPLRGIYCATHFGNWYDNASDREVAEYIEDLALWGCNQVRVWFDMHDFKGPDDPRARVQVEKLKRILRVAERCGIETSLVTLANEAFADSPEGLRAEWRAGQNGYQRELVGHYHVEICPSRPGGLELILKERGQMLDLFADVKLAEIGIFPYDQGGCTCAGCAPWGVNGMFRILPGFSRLVKERFPGCRIEFGTWRFDAFGDLGEWKRLFARGEELRKYADALSVGWADKVLGGAPGGLPVSEMSEISMGGMLPWGGYGANPRPRLFEGQVRRGVGCLAGFRPYSEGIYEDLNKVLFLSLGWDPVQGWQKVVGDYAAFHFGVMSGEFVDAVGLLEDNLGHSCSFVQDGNAYGVYDAVKIDRSRPFIRKMNMKRLDAEKARKALSLLEGVESRMAPARRETWRWRLFVLRARIDVLLAEGAGCEDPRLRTAFNELALIYRVGRNTEPCLAPELDGTGASSSVGTCTPIKTRCK